ncbi:hypothetical protein N665_0171s0011 [Sinapis alba]|nr:hypothetical protein N665_0171s0011 [Sinapis alba]
MDSINFDSVKAEKAMALRRYNRFSRFFRAAEVSVAILFPFWTFSRLPFAVQISREFLRRIAGVISTPLFVFLLGNCIVVVLLTKSSVEEDNNRGSSPHNAETDHIYEALVLRSVENRYKEEDLLEDEIVYDDKEVIVIDLTSSDIPHEENNQPKVYGRSKSDVKQTSEADMVNVIPSLQRSETEKCMRIDDNNNKKNSYEEDNLSNEEFQKTIEAFIAKQLIFRRQESLSVVVHNKA